MNQVNPNEGRQEGAGDQVSDSLFNKLGKGPINRGPLSGTFSPEEITLLKKIVAESPDDVAEIVTNFSRAAQQSGFFRPNVLLVRWAREAGISDDVIRDTINKELEAAFKSD